MEAYNATVVAVQILTYYEAKNGNLANWHELRRAITAALDERQYEVEYLKEKLDFVAGTNAALASSTARGIAHPPKPVPTTPPPPESVSKGE